MPRFTPERSESIRANLIDHVAKDPAPHRRGVWAAGFMLVGALAGAGVSAGAFASTGIFTSAPSHPAGEHRPAYPDAVPAPPGVTPGAPIISLLGEPISRQIDAATQLSLTDRPDAATHARVTITPLAAGTLTWGTEPDGNNPWGSWSREDVIAGSNSEAWYDFPLDDSVDVLYLDPSAFTGIVTVQYVTHLPTELGVNANGQTYGVGDSPQGEPDLVSVVGIAGDGSPVDGYAFANELIATNPDYEGLPSDPEEAVRRQDEAAQKYPHGWTIPVYASDGTTRIGDFRVGG
jgi:hypothetical protein